MSDNASRPPSDLVDDVHLGVSEMDTDPVFPSSDEHETEDEYPFDLRVEAVFNRLASEIYETNSAGIREGLTNAVTSVLRARRRGHLPANEGTIEFTVYEGSGTDPGYLTLRDNGMGMSLDEIDEVVSVIGATTARQDGDLAGQFGMGFLALYKLVGLNGSFVMHSNSRLTENGPFTGVWRARGFTHDSNQRMEQPFDEDEYGVRFDFPLREEISTDEVTNWIYRIAEWARVPVVFERYDASGTLIEDDELGGRQADDQLEEADLYVEYEDEYVHAVAGQDVPDQTLLLDVPIQRSTRFNLLDDLPWRRPSMFVRFKNEKRPVVDGPNKGKMVANPKEYDVLDEQGIAGDFISERDLNEDDTVMPAPLGNRDRLEQGDGFWEWLADRLFDSYRQDVKDIVVSLESPEDAYTLPEDDYVLLRNVLPETTLDDDEDVTYENVVNVPSYRQSLERAFDAAFPNDTLVEALNIFTAELPMVSTGVSDAESTTNHSDTLVLDIFRETVTDDDENGTVYIGSTMNNKKAAVVWDDHKANRIIATPSTDWYDPLEDLGCEYLKNIRKSTLDQYDISERTRERFHSDEADSDAVEEGHVTLHFGRHPRKRSQTRRETIQIETLVDEVATDGPITVGEYTPSHVVGFPRSSSWNLSEYRSRLSSSAVAVASFTSPEWEHVKEYEDIIGIEEYVSAAESQSIPTSHGNMTLPEATTRGDVLVHAVSDDVAPLFQTTSRMESLASVFDSGQWSLNARFWGLDESNRAHDTLVYAPVGETVFRQLLPILDKYDVFVTGSDIGYGRDDPGQLVSAPRDASLYAIAELPNWRQSETLAIIEAGVERRSVSLADERDAVENLVAALKTHEN